MKRRTLVLLGLGAGLSAAVVVSARKTDRSPLAVLAEGERTQVETSDGAVLTVDVNGPEDGPVVVLAMAGQAQGSSFFKRYVPRIAGYGPPHPGRTKGLFRFGRAPAEQR